ncbi:MAG: hypothetical protein P8P98_06890 [Emcibacteraceae bacterium]|nr:hypothetical protein [Emcibacteraceae bacterium]MDG1859532.1 hypothetical protein [Emcibacteraceae bacterium]
MSEDIMWFWAVLIFTVPPVLRFRENFLVPGLAMLLTFGFYTQAYWLPDFYNINDWLGIIGICVAILEFYFVCGFIVHYLWFKGKSENLRNYGAFGPLFRAWIKGRTYVVNDDFVAEIRRLRMFEMVWDDVKSVTEEEGVIIMTDNVKREPEILSEIRISEKVREYKVIKDKLISQGKL